MESTFWGDLIFSTAKEFVYVKFKYDQGIEFYLLVRHIQEFLIDNNQKEFIKK
jgi:hypothetical protein